MSDSNSEVVGYMFWNHPEWLKEPVRGYTPNPEWMDPSSELIPLVPESLLLDARAEVEAKDCEIMGQLMKLRFAYERIDELEALTGEYERDARRYRWLVDMWTRPPPFSKEVAAVLDSFRSGNKLAIDSAIDTAIDAVGGRGET